MSNKQKPLLEVTTVSDLIEDLQVQVKELQEKSTNQDARIDELETALWMNGKSPGEPAHRAGVPLTVEEFRSRTTKDKK